MAAVGGGAWYALGSTDDATSPPDPDSSTQLDIAPQDVSNPLIVPIDDAEDVIAEIDENGSESEALDALGLDDTGNPIAAVDAVAGYRYTWDFGAARTATVTVDVTTGDSVTVDGSGLEIRRIGNRAFASTGGSPWVELDPSADSSAPPLGFDALLTIDRVLDSTTAGFSTSVTMVRGDDTSRQTAEVDAFRYASEQPEAFRRWMTGLGHPEAESPFAPGDLVVVQADLATDGHTIDLMTVATATSTTSYSLDEVLATAPLVELPEL
jgi:hypothetical protein